MVTAAIATSACSTTPMIVTAEQLCKDWRDIKVSKADKKITEETAQQIEANNLSRPAWGCKLGENRAS